MNSNCLFGSTVQFPHQGKNHGRNHVYSEATIYSFLKSRQFLPWDVRKLLLPHIQTSCNKTDLYCEKCFHL